MAEQFHIFRTVAPTLRNLLARVWPLALILAALAGAVGLVYRQSAVADRIYRIGWQTDTPFQMAGAGGEPTGLAVDLVREAARRRRIRLEWVLLPEGPDKALRTGKADLWPLMTILPGRRKYVHITEPYLETELCFLVRKSSPYLRVGDLTHATISTAGMSPDLLYMQGLTPRATVVAETPSEQMVRDVCQGRSDASFLDLYTAIYFLFEEGGCAGEPLRWITVPGMRPQLGIGAVFQARAAADALRNEIGRIVAEGGTPPTLGKWAYMSGLQLRQVEELVNAQRKERLLRAGIALTTLLLMITLFQTARIRRERNRTRQMENALRGTEQRLRLISNNLKEMVLAYGMDARLIYANPAVEELTGYSLAELEARGFINWVHPDDAPRMIGYWDRLFQGYSYRDEEYRLIAKDGAVKWAAATWGPILDEKGRQVGVQGCERDITERKRAEAEREKLSAQLVQAQKLESIGRLAGGVAHDFNNLLTVINGYSEFLVAQLKAGDPLRLYADEIKTAGERAASLTKQLLAFSRKQVIEPKVLDLNTTIRQSAPMLQRLIGEDIRLGTHLDDNLGQVMADPDQIHQVIMNLAVNARDAMPDGGNLEIATANVDLAAEDTTAIPADSAPGRYVLLSVTDTGEGMDETIRKNIFEPFFTTKQAGKGTGLGLSTVYGIIRQNGGWIDVWSEVGVGSAFKIYLPRTDEAPVAPKGGISSPTEGGIEKILVVEDQEAVRSFVVVALRQYGYQVLEASDGNEAMTIAGCQLGQLDLLLTDVVMPGMNGRELSGRLKELYPDLRVLFISGYTADVIARRGVLDPGVTFLHKPFSAEELAAKVREVLAAAQTGRS